MRAVGEQFGEAIGDDPVGFLVTGDTVSTAAPITRRDDRVLQLPYWFYLMLC